MLMTFEQLKKNASKDIVSFLAEDWEVKENRVTKHNRGELTGLTFMPKGSDGGPTIYAEDMYDHYLHGVPYEKIIENFGRSIAESYAAHNDFSKLIEDLTLDKIKDNLCLRLVDKKRNEKLLEKAAYRDIGADFAVTADICWSNASGITRACITNDILGTLNVTKDELFDAATSCQIKAAEPILVPLIGALNEGSASGAALKGNALKDGSIRESNEPYILTTADDMNGAVALAYPGVLERISLLLGGDFYVLPSSIHEVIVIKADDPSKETHFQQTIIDANHSVLEMQDVLTDSLLICHDGNLERVGSETTTVLN